MNKSYLFGFQLYDARAKLSTLESSLQGTQYGLNTTLILFGAFGVFVMQIGFAMFVAGVVRCAKMHAEIFDQAPVVAMLIR